MSYEVRFDEGAVRDLRRVGNAEARRITARLGWLAEHIDETSSEMLAGAFHGLLKLRIGDYRVAYTVDRPANVIRVHMVGHRREIYDIDPDQP